MVADLKRSRIYTKRVDGDEFLFVKLEKDGELVEVQLEEAVISG